jgi:hemoglobin-like flavoprotein
MFKFGGENTAGSDDDDLYKSRLFATHAKALFGMVDAAVGLVQEGKSYSLSEVLVDLGSKHSGFGVKLAHYPVVGEAFMHTLHAALGKEFTREVHDGWKLVWGVVSSGMIQGTYYEEFGDQ